MTTLKRFVTIGSLAVLGLFGLYVISAPFLREPPAPVVQVTIAPQPLTGGQQARRDRDETGDAPAEETVETPEIGGLTTSGPYQIGERTGELLNRLWSATENFVSGLGSTVIGQQDPRPVS